MRKLLFIVNPRSGKRNSSEIIKKIKHLFPSSISYDIQTWHNIEEFKKIETILKTGNYTDAIAVGGDGSVSLVAQTILNTDISLGIIPTGSGNGLARSLGISMKTEVALKQIIEGKAALIDSGSVNGIPFFCTSGAGFDAHIGQLFANLKKRGLKTYIKIVLKEFSSYKAQKCSISIDGKVFEREAFLLTVANAGQYGNDFYIAPQAKLTDGLFHLVIVKPFPFFRSMGLLNKVLRHRIHRSKYVETFTGRKIIIKRSAQGVIHCDGEPYITNAELQYAILPRSVKTIVGSTFRE